MTITTDPWRDDPSVSISACGMWMARVGVQVSRSEFHTHIHLNYAKVQFLYCIKKIKKKKKRSNNKERKFIW